MHPFELKDFDFCGDINLKLYPNPSESKHLNKYIYILDDLELNVKCLSYFNTELNKYELLLPDNNNNIIQVLNLNNSDDVIYTIFEMFDSMTESIVTHDFILNDCDEETFTELKKYLK